MIALNASTALALAGTALFAVAIFVPRRGRETPIPAATVSYAPPPIERWLPSDSRESEESRYTPASEDAAPFDGFAYAGDTPAAVLSVEDDAPEWPRLIDARAARADARTRADLADALCAIGSDWSRTILAHALAEERDEIVRARLVSGRTDPRVHPTPAYADES